MTTRDRLSDPSPTDGVGPRLKAWREARGLSQLDLSFDAGLSQRQISFIETGRSVPGRANLLVLADALEIPFRDRNPLLLAAGYAPIYEEAALDDAAMAPINTALQRMLQQHEPFPALVLDRYWNVVSRNSAARRFFGLFVDIDDRPEPRNLLELVFDPTGLRPFLRDWEATASSLLARVMRESVGHVLDDRARDLIGRLTAFPDVEPHWAESGDPTSHSPVIPLTFVNAGKDIPLFSLVTTVGTPQTISAQELRLESMFPLNGEAEARYLRMIGESRN